MSDMKYFFTLFLFRSIIAIPQLNLYYTDLINGRENDNDNALQHNCLHILNPVYDPRHNRETITYCLSMLPSKFQVEIKNIFPNFTFIDLYQRNINSEHLYNWSAPIDIIESYQFYLDQLSSKNDSSLGKQVYYNCTLPRFGPQCQYELFNYNPDGVSLHSVIEYFYIKHRSNSTDLTCYEHLNCSRGPFPACLHWSEICDGKVDCLDGDFDEEHCWELEINQCKEDEYRCMNGQCIPQIFFQDGDETLDCIDHSDFDPRVPESDRCFFRPPSIGCDDIKCDSTHLTSSCLLKRADILKSMYSIKDGSVSEDCWSALKCFTMTLDSEALHCYDFCEENPCEEIIKNTCPDMFFFPNVPVLFGHIYLAFKKCNSTNEKANALLYICSKKSYYDTFFDMITEILFNNTRCFLHHTISYSWPWRSLWSTKHNRSLLTLYNQLRGYQMIYHYNSTVCNRSSMYQCRNSSFDGCYQ
jgi:hypothetical protein